ncbi:unnamed protein product [Mytilus coruscus]|uniref:Uncharacterized protein n=1 Tax=Mytilus coruscus TaxID=42192 RepID=A0A6J8BP67_MYTCO|nr:unnamed protein product [Mytilus coruscus]
MPKENDQLKTLEYIGLLVLWEAIDMVTDWVLYSDVKSIEPGLVYGPPDDGLIRALLAFSVIGTLTFVAQVVILLIEFFNEGWLTEQDSVQNFVYENDVVSLLTIILEDFPQAVITLTLVTCREEGISYVQIAKAILPMIEILARIMCSCVKLREKKSSCDLLHLLGKCKEIEWKNVIGWTRVLVLLVVFILNVAMLILSTTETDVDVYGNSKSTLKGRHFKYIFDEKYNDERYLKNVGIYLHHPAFDYKTFSSKSWINLIEIYDLENANVAEFRLLIDAETQSNFTIEKSTCKDPFPKLSECFQLLKNEIKIISPCNNFFTKYYTFALRFEFKERDIPRLLLGDVNYNWKTDITGNCSQNIGNEVIIPSVHYYRSKPDVNTTHHLNWSKYGIRFFNNDDLIDVRYLWKTSFSSCQSNGRTSPHLDNGIRLNCA